MKKGLEKLADFLKEHPLILASCALLCAVLGAALLGNQVLLNRTVQAKLTNAEAETLPSIHWYDEQTTAPAATTQTPVQSIETEPAAAEYGSIGMTSRPRRLPPPRKRPCRASRPNPPQRSML